MSVLVALCAAFTFIPSKSRASASAGAKPTAALKAAPESANDAIKIATIYPADSGVGRVFQVWARAVDARTNGAVQLDFDYSSEGGDDSFIERMDDGGLDGALLTASGLGKISQPIHRFEIPGKGGGIVISSETLEKLSEEQRAILVETAGVAAKNLTRAIS